MVRVYGCVESPARFVVVDDNWPAGQRRPTIQHFQNAFDAAGGGEFYS